MCPEAVCARAVTNKCVCVFAEAESVCVCVVIMFRAWIEHAPQPPALVMVI